MNDAEKIWLIYENCLFCKFSLTAPDSVSQYLPYDDNDVSNDAKMLMDYGSSATGVHDSSHGWGYE